MRIEDWDAARYSFVPPRAALDARLTLIHFRFLVMLGRINTAQGWCSLSQTEFAKAQGYARPSVSRAVGELVEWRYVEKHGQDESGSSRCHYRMLMDEPEPTEIDTCHLPRDTPQSGVECHLPRDTSVTSQVTDVSPTKDTLRRSEIEDLPPSAPSLSTSDEQGGADQSSISKAVQAVKPSAPTGWASGWTSAARSAVAELAASNDSATVAIVDVFVAAIRAERNPPAHIADKAGWVRQLIRLRRFDDATLAALAAQQLADRSRDIDVIEKLEAMARRIVAVGGPIAAATPGAAPITINRDDHPAQVAAWIAYARQHGRISTDPKVQSLYALGRMLEQQGRWSVPTEFPPTPPTPPTPSAEVAP